MDIDNEQIKEALANPQAVFKKMADAMREMEMPVYNGMRVLESPLMGPDEQMLMVGTERMKKIKRAIAEYDEKHKADT